MAQLPLLKNLSKTSIIIQTNVMKKFVVGPIISNTFSFSTSGREKFHVSNSVTAIPGKYPPFLHLQEVFWILPIYTFGTLKMKPTNTILTDGHRIQDVIASDFAVNFSKHYFTNMERCISYSLNSMAASWGK